MQGCVLVRNHFDHTKDNSSCSTQETECIPEENVSIIEDMSAEEKIQNMKAVVNGTRRKLYFNPAYFEPQLLMVILSYYCQYAYKTKTFYSV